jgi:hypothetical protein
MVTGEDRVMAKAERPLLVVLVVLGLLAAACGGSHPSSTSGTVASGQLAGGQIPAGANAGGSKSGDTVPLAKQNPITTLFSSINSFQSCLKGLGVTFIGAPDASDPSSGTNSPAYIKSLTTCATQSNILQALKTEETAQDNLTPSQIKHENQEYLVFRKCMIARGWGIPVPKPNANGLLFSFGGATGTSGGGVPQLTPPPGQSILSSSDMEACASKAQSGT